LPPRFFFGGPAIAAWAFDLFGPEIDLFKPDLSLPLQCIALCFVTSLVLGLLSALRFSRPSIIAALKNDSAGSGQRVGRLQRITAAAQARLAVPFLVMCGVQFDQARAIAIADVGFKTRGLYPVRPNLSAVARGADEQRLFVRRCRRISRRRPGVLSTSVGDGVPLDFIDRNTRVCARGGVGLCHRAHDVRRGRIPRNARYPPARRPRDRTPTIGKVRNKSWRYQSPWRESSSYE